MGGRHLTDEERAFIRDYPYPLWTLRETFRERFGWSVGDSAIFACRRGRRRAPSATPWPRLNEHMPIRPDDVPLVADFDPPKECTRRYPRKRPCA